MGKLMEVYDKAHPRSFKKITPHPSPLPRGERDGGEGVNGD
jgi:hypothetical protein